MIKAEKVSRLDKNSMKQYRELKDELNIEPALERLIRLDL